MLNNAFDFRNVILFSPGGRFVFAELHLDYGRLDRMGLSEVKCSPLAFQGNDPGSFGLPNVASLWEGTFFY